MKTIVLNQEDFKEEAYWIALCDSLDVPNIVDSITLDVRVIHIEPD